MISTATTAIILSHNQQPQHAKPVKSSQHKACHSRRASHMRTQHRSSTHAYALFINKKPFSLEMEYVTISSHLNSIKQVTSLELLAALAFCLILSRPVHKIPDSNPGSVNLISKQVILNQLNDFCIKVRIIFPTVFYKNLIQLLAV